MSNIFVGTFVPIRVARYADLAYESCWAIRKASYIRVCKNICYSSL